MSDVEFLSGFERHVFHYIAVGILQQMELWIDSVVEDISFQQFDYFRRCVNADRLMKITEQVINEDRQAGDVIHVGMRDNHVANALLLYIAQRNSDRAGVNCDAVVDDKASKALRGTGAAVGVERA